MRWRLEERPSALREEGKILCLERSPAPHGVQGVAVLNPQTKCSSHGVVWGRSDPLTSNLAQEERPVALTDRAPDSKSG